MIGCKAFSPLRVCVWMIWAQLVALTWKGVEALVSGDKLEERGLWWCIVRDFILFWVRLVLFLYFLSTILALTHSLCHHV